MKVKYVFEIEPAQHNAKICLDDHHLKVKTFKSHIQIINY